MRRRYRHAGGWGQEEGSHAEVVASGGEEDEVFDDEGRLLRTVFIENLPLRTKKKALTKEFTTFGVVDSVRIRSVPLGDCTMEALQGGTMEGFFNLISYFQTQSEPALQPRLPLRRAQRVVGLWGLRDLEALVAVIRILELNQVEVNNAPPLRRPQGRCRRPKPSLVRSLALPL
ncbi:hypothetical protein ZWY2020_044550 [Hordeum vulgare]|nr:hypothetical protein ZWY2020_044550 [Hordeum vulgare]